MRIKRIFCLLLLLTSFSYQTFAQSPGGVSADLIVWYKADNGVISSGDGAEATTWTNQATHPSGTYNLTLNTVGRTKPTYFNTQSDRLINFNPTLSFVGGASNGVGSGGQNIMNTNTLMPNNSAFTFIGVNVDENVGINYNNIFVTSDTSSDHKFTFHKQNRKYILYQAFHQAYLSPTRNSTTADHANTFSQSGGNNGYFNGSTFVTNTAVTQNIQPQTFAIASASGSGATLQSYIDGYFISTPAGINNTNSFHEAFSVGGYVTDRYSYTGRIPEIMGFSRQLSATEIQRVNSYLSIKYGTTLGQGGALANINRNAANYNYLASNGNVLWNASNNTGYNYNITGIGRDDTSGLTQKQSKSVNKPGLVTIGKSNIVATNAANTGTFATDRDFLLFGDNNGSITSFTSAGAPTYLQKLNRTWKVSEVGTNAADYTISVPDNSSSQTTKLPFIQDSNDIMYLLIDDDTDFSTGTELIAMTLVGTNWIINNVNLNDNQFYTFAAGPLSLDTDGDGVVDSADLDDDNDGILDADEQGDICGYSGGTDFTRLTYTNNVGVQVNTLSSNSIAVNRASGGTASTYTNEVFSLPLRLEFTTEQVTPLTYIGLIGTTQTKTPGSSNDGGHKFYFFNNTSYYVRDGGTNSGLDSYTASDVFTIDIETNGNLTMYKNSTVVYTDVVGDAEFQLSLASSTGSPVRSFNNLFLASDYEDYYGCNDLDTDNDGLVNRLDLDSDQDGCFDALEGDAPETQIGYAELNPDGSITGSVDTDGIPNTASGGQDIGTSINATQQASECSPCYENNPNFVDTDGDLEGDFCDLDDDNDGILDSDECGIGVVDFSTLNFTNQDVVLNNSGIINIVSGTLTTVTSSSASGDNLGNLRLSDGDNSLPNPPDYTFGDSYELIFNSPTQVIISHITANIGGFDGLYAGGDEWRLTAAGGFTFSDPDGQLEIQSIGTDFIEFRPRFNAYFAIGEGTWEVRTLVPTSSITFQASGNPASAVNVRVTCEDTDGDNTPDYLDLDSDGDGCPDALEGDAPETQIGYTELNSNSSITGAVDVNGIPDTATGGQGIGTSQDSAQQAAECSPCDVNNPEYVDADGDLLGDFCDFDDDNDGILDTDEKDCSGFVPIDLSAITNLSNSSINNQPISAVPFATRFSSAITANHTSTVTTRPLGLSNGDLRFIQGNNTEVSEYRIDFDHPTSIQLSQAEVNGAFERLETWTITTEGGSISVNNPVIDVVTDNGTVWNDTELQNISGNLTNRVTFSPRTAASDGNISIADSEWSLTAVQVKSLTIRVQTSSPGNNATRIKVSANCVPIDTDEDGTPNDKDLDSDSDGCPDALEGDAAENQIGYAQLNPDSSITGVVNADGIPNIASGGQGIGTSYDATQQAAECSPCNVNNPDFVDTDGDLVGDLCDLDDDNDGIFDCDESSNQISGRFTWSLNDPMGGLEVDYASDPEILTYPLSSTGTMSFGAGTSVDLSSSQVLLTSIVSPNLSEAVANEEYIEVSFTTGATSQFRIENIQSGWFTPSNSGDSYRTSAFFGKTSSANPSAVSGDMLHTNTGATYIQFDHLNGTLQLEPNEDYTLRFYVFGQIDDDPSTNSIFDDISIFLTACEAVDTDGDGTFDHLDLDSDEDGCDDVIEAGFTDDNNDGLLGPNPVVVDGDGRVTSGSDGYTTPADGDANGTFDFQEAGSPPTITTQATNLTLCPGCSGVFNVATNDADSFQWQVFNGIDWDDLLDGGVYSGTSTTTLSITQPTTAENNSRYRLLVSSSAYRCTQLISDEVTLTVRATTVITNRQRTYRVNKN